MTDIVTHWQCQCGQVEVDLGPLTTVTMYCEECRTSAGPVLTRSVQPGQ